MSNLATVCSLCMDMMTSVRNSYHLFLANRLFRSKNEIKQYEENGLFFIERVQ